MVKANAKILRQFPQLKDFQVKLNRSPRIEEMLKEFALPVRASTRIIMKQQKEDEVRNQPIPVKAIAAPARQKQESKSLVKSTVSPPIQPKSIMIKKNNRMRNRSKSVCFDPNVLPPTPIRPKVALAKRNLFGNVSSASVGVCAGAGTSGLAKARRASCNDAIAIDSPSSPIRRKVPLAKRKIPLTKRNLSGKGSSGSVGAKGWRVSPNNNAPIDLTTHRFNVVSPVNDENVPLNDQDVPAVANFEDVTTRTDDPADSGLSSGEILAYETRISNLINSNQNKINKIQQLMADRKALSNQNDSLHRMNRVLTAAVDRYRAETQDQGMNISCIHKFLHHFLSFNSLQVVHQTMSTNAKLKRFK